MSIIVHQDATIYSLLYFCRLLYMFRVVIPPIIGTHITVITACDTGQTVSASFRYRDEVRTKLLFHPSSGAHIIVSTASGTGQTISATFCYRDEVGTSFEIRHDSGS